MSWETQSWAAKQRTGSASAKLVLLGLASCADANHCAYPSVDWLCEFGALNRKTVIAALQRLETGDLSLIEDTGERRGRTRQVKVYRLRVEEVYRASSLGADPATKTVPKSEQSRNRNGKSVSKNTETGTVPVSDGKRPKNGTRNLSGNLPPSDDKSSETPHAENQSGEETGTAPEADPEPETPARPTRARTEAKGTRIAPDWSPPPVADLPPMAAQLLAEWPRGAYEVTCEAFRLHWISETRSIGVKANWLATLGKWLIKEHPVVMRNAKAGVSYARLAKAVPVSATAPAAPPVERSLENGMADPLRLALKSVVGQSHYAAWFEPAALLLSGDTLRIVARGGFSRDYMEANFGSEIRQALGKAGITVETIQFDVSGGTKREKVNP